MGNDAGFMQIFQRPGDAGQVSRPVIHDADHDAPLHFLPCQLSRVSISRSIASGSSSSWDTAEASARRRHEDYMLRRPQLQAGARGDPHTLCRPQGFDNLHPGGAQRGQHAADEAHDE